MRSQRPRLTVQLDIARVSYWLKDPTFNPESCAWRFLANWCCGALPGIWNPNQTLAQFGQVRNGDGGWAMILCGADPGILTHPSSLFLSPSFFPTFLPPLPLILLPHPPLLYYLSLHTDWWLPGQVSSSVKIPNNHTGSQRSEIWARKACGQRRNIAPNLDRSYMCRRVSRTTKEDSP